jgi:molybdopterin-guanine dinucleotide biosynthesis protein A
MPLVDKRMCVDEGLVTTIVLAGGKSSRMGQDKAGLLLREKALLEWVVDGVAPISHEVLLIGNERPFHVGTNVPFRWTPDILPDMGPLGGIYSGLLASQSELNFVIACDMPFVNVGLARHMIEHYDDAQVVAAEVDEQLEPLHALYHISCVEKLHEAMLTNQLQLQRLLRSLRLQVISSAEVVKHDRELRCFFNINTPQDYLQAEEITRSHDWR